MHVAKTDQAARMRSSCCRNTSEQLIMARKYMRLLTYTIGLCLRNHNAANSLRDCLLDNHVVISESRKSRLRSLVR